MSRLRGSVALYLAYLALMASIFGWMRCILTDDFIIWKRVGSMARLMTRVSRRIAQPQLGTTCSNRNRMARNSGLAITENHPKFTTCSRLGPLVAWMD